MWKRLLKAKLTLLVLTLLYTIILICSPAEAASGTVVTVDGIGGWKTLWPLYTPPSASNYLYNAIDLDWRLMFKEKIGPVQFFPWGGNPSTQTNIAVESLYTTLKAISENNKITNAPLVIISHSWGTVLTYIVLHNHPDIIVDKLITTGSPLEQEVTPIVSGYTNFALLSLTGSIFVDSLPNVRIWHNYWAWCDPVSASVFAATNYESNFSINFDGICHNSYFDDPIEWQKILFDAYNTQHPLKISYLPIVPSAPVEVTFNATGSLISDSDSSYTWDFENGQTETGQNVMEVKHYYKQPGDYNIKLTMTNSSGSRTVTESVIVRPPKIVVTYPNGFESLLRHFSTPLNVHVPNALDYAWNYGDGSPTEYGLNLEHNFPTSGNYNVSLTLTLDDGSTVISTAQIFVGPGTRTISGHTIYNEETWYSGGIYVIQGNINVARGTTLTIEPGVIVRLTQDATINVEGALTANGVTFTWSDGQNQWAGIRFSGAAANGSKLENCVFEHAAGYRYWNSGAWSSNYGIVDIQNSSPTITGCTIRDSIAGYGIYIKDGSPIISNSTVSGIMGQIYGYGIYVSGASSNPTVTGNTITGNASAGIADNSGSGNGTYQNNIITANKYGILVYYTLDNRPVFINNHYQDNADGDLQIVGTIINAVTWDTVGDTVYRIAWLNIAVGGSLTIAPGVTVKLDKDATVNVEGTLIANGATFTWADGQNQWAGIRFSGAAANGSKLENCVFEHAAGYRYWNSGAWSSNYGIVDIQNSSPTITGCTIRGSIAGYGIYIKDGSPVISNNTVSGIMGQIYGYGIYVSGASSNPTVTGNTITGNASAGIADNSGSGNGTYQNNIITANKYGILVYYTLDNRPVFINNHYQDNADGDLQIVGTIINAVTWDTVGDTVYRIAWLNIAVGGSLTIAPGVTVKLDKDATVNVEGTLIANGATFTWADGQNQWAGIRFSGAAANGSKLENCVFEHAAGYRYWNSGAWSSNYGIVDIQNSSPTITGCTIRDSATYGIYCTGTSKPTIDKCIFSSNISYGVYNANTTIYINAKYNNWGDPSGPLDDSDDRNSVGLYNPDGKGTKVSNYVDYYPWIGSQTHILGDVNNDLHVDLTDAIMAVKIFSSTTQAKRIYKEADVNADGKIGIEEMIYIMQAVSGLR